MVNIDSPRPAWGLEGVMTAQWSKTALRRFLVGKVGVCESEPL